MDLTQRFDAVVVGSGAGGAAVCWGLVQAGLNVLVLEAGPYFDAQADYPLTNPGWERRGFPQKLGSQTRITYGDLGILAPEFDDLASWSRAGYPWRLPAGAPRPASALGYSYVMGVGGSTLHYVGEAHRLHPTAFDFQTRTGIGADWPLSYADLEPFYTEVEKQIGVAGPEQAGARWRSAAFPLPAHPLSPGAQVLHETGAKLGQSWVANARAALSKPYADRPACNYCGQCARGCPIGDKGSMDVTFLRSAQDTGRLTIADQAVVTRLFMGRSGDITHLDVVREGERHRIETPILVLSGGAVQTPRLLMLSANSDLPAGLANGSGHLGRHFMETLSWQATGLLDGLNNSHMGLPGDAIWWGPSAPGQATTHKGGFRLSHGTQENGLTGPVNYATRLVPGFGKSFKADMRNRFGTALSIGAIGQVVPDARSFITLDPETTDAQGLPAAQINSVLTSESYALLRQMAEAARSLLNESGAEIVEERGSWDQFTATHVFGTARMGTDATRSVVDASGRSHDHRNLWIADASVFPTSGGGESPGLTIMALALRTAKAITT